MALVKCMINDLVIPIKKPNPDKPVEVKRRLGDGEKRRLPVSPVPRIPVSPSLRFNRINPVTMEMYFAQK